MARPLTAVLAALVGAAAWSMSGASVASAAPPETAYVLADVQCDPAGDGVVDLVLVNDAETDLVRFVVDGIETNVAPLSAQAVTFSQISDGDVDIPVLIDDVESRVHLTVRCDLPMVEVAPPPVPLRPGGTGGVSALSGPDTPSPVTMRMLPATGMDQSLWVLAALMIVSGGVLALIARRRASNDGR
jgi:LPXTG-motif cell wall-anchored protein